MTKQYRFYGDLVAAFGNFRVALHVNDSLGGHVLLLFLGIITHYHEYDYEKYITNDLTSHLIYTYFIICLVYIVATK